MSPGANVATKPLRFPRITRRSTETEVCQLRVAFCTVGVRIGRRSRRQMTDQTVISTLMPCRGGVTDRHVRRRVDFVTRCVTSGRGGHGQVAALVTAKWPSRGMWRPAARVGYLGAAAGRSARVRPTIPEEHMSDAGHNKWKALAVLGIAYLMVVLDVAIVNVALSAVDKDLEFNPADLQWIVSGYALTFGGFLLLGGRMGDILGRRKIFVAGLIAFAAFSLLCGLATTPALLITARILQGAGAALVSPSVFSIVSVTFEEGAERNKALGVLGAIAGSGAAIGVLLGGILTEYASWRWCFLINVPIAIITLFLVPKFVQESRAEGQSRHFDAVGAVLVTGSLMMLVYGLTQANGKGWGSAHTLGFLIGAAALMALFLLVEHRGKAPLVPLGFFKNRTATGANVIGFGLGTIVFGMFLLLSLYMPYVLGYSTLKTGIAYLAVALTAVVASGAAQALVTKISIKVALLIGMGLLGLGLLTFTQLAVDGTYMKHLFPGFILIGVGLGFSFVPVSIAALAGVKPQEAGLASGLINTSQQVGGAVGVAILTTVAASVAGSIPPRPPFDAAQKAALTDGYSTAFWVALIFVAVSLIATFTMLRGKELTDATSAGHVPAG